MKYCKKYKIIESVQQKFKKEFKNRPLDLLTPQINELLTMLSSYDQL